MTGIPLQALLVGDVRSLGPRGIPSGIAKSPVDRPLMLGVLGLAGDAQGDTRHHGGAEKALHHYALDHYPAWVAEIGPRDVLGAAGAFGENLATSGQLESDVAVGDVFAIGSAVIEVSQGRQTCWKLNERFAQPDMARRVQASCRTGWYYRSRVKLRPTVGLNAFTVPHRPGRSAAYGGCFMSTRSIAANSRRLGSCHSWPRAGDAMRGADWKPDRLKTGHRGWPATHAPTDV